MQEPFVPLASGDDPFCKLPPERQEAIANAALEAFGAGSYKEASTDQIAHRAGISKGLLFFYCKNKRQLYLHTMEFLYDKVVNMVVDDAFWQIDDFFELLGYAARSKGELLKRFPWALSFCIRAFYPDHRDIKDVMDRWNREQVGFMFDRFLVNVRWDRFRDDVDPRHVLDMLIWLADGWMHQRQAAREPVGLDELMEEFELWTDMLRTWSYKPEYQGTAASTAARADGARESATHAGKTQQEGSRA